MPDTVTYHVACHLQAQNMGLRARDLLKLAGVKCTLVQRCSGIDGTWGYRAENYDLARQVAAPLGRDIEAAANDIVCGDCHLANGSIRQETGRSPLHPMQVMSRRVRRRRPVTERTDEAVPELTLADVLDLRAYERVRGDYRARVMARKRIRRVGLGPFMTLIFESVDTVRFQIQEMARAEKIISDEGIQTELDIYNRLLPSEGELSATLFIELTSEGSLREWLPRLVGIERQVGIQVGADLVMGSPEAEHAAALTRDAVTSAVHYLRFPFSEGQVNAFAHSADDDVALVATHPSYEVRTTLSREVRSELLGDLRSTTKWLPMA